jgi:hypothetical protein
LRPWLDGFPSSGVPFLRARLELSCKPGTPRDDAFGTCPHLWHPLRCLADRTGFYVAALLDSGNRGASPFMARFRVTKLAGAPEQSFPL